MVYHYWLGIIFMAVTSAVSALSHLSPDISRGRATKDGFDLRTHNTAAREGISNMISDNLFYAHTRRRRGMSTAARLVKKGKDAVKYLVHDATELIPKQFPSNPSTNLVRHFEKFGDYRQALIDFYGVKPDNVKDFTTPTGLSGKAAFVGDRILYAKSSNEFTGTPTLEVLKIDIKSKRVKLTELISYYEIP